jgi:hypothetical protein
MIAFACLFHGLHSKTNPLTRICFNASTDPLGGAGTILIEAFSYVITDSSNTVVLGPIQDQKLNSNFLMFSRTEE